MNTNLVFLINHVMYMGHNYSMKKLKLLRGLFGVLIDMYIFNLLTHLDVLWDCVSGMVLGTIMSD